MNITELEEETQQKKLSCVLIKHFFNRMIY
jgi:hypothetical protein